jgi:mRNA interferase MazF
MVVDLMQAGDLVEVDFGIPAGSEPGFRRPAVVITSDVVPVTTNVQRAYLSDVRLDDSELQRDSVAQCHLCTVVSVERVGPPSGAIGAVALAQIRSIVGDLLDIPGR